jgi:LmbE family N-acetylglucosaminyl deacetylase
MTQGPTSPEDRGRQIGETFGELSEQIAALVRDELERMREETAERAREAAKAGTYLGATAVFGLAGAGAALSLPVLALRRFLPPSATAVAATAGYGALAVVLGRRALERLEAAAPRSVEEKIEEKKEDVAASLKERLPGGSGS